ncbi:MAG: type III-B CRISPR module-associated protein Cmr5 [Chloroflexota bacterium]|nr:type III-B CRISPR module-associated protein Cmr5 [Chloroflexota bacterium]
MPRTIEMERAQSAWEAVQAVKTRSRPVRSVYGARARDMVAMIMTDGLGQTLAFLLAKSKNKPTDSHRLLFNDISTWVLNRLSPGAQGGHLLRKIITEDTSFYRRATAETIAYATWLKKFVEAEFGDEISLDVDTTITEATITTPDATPPQGVQA